MNTKEAYDILKNRVYSNFFILGIQSSVNQQPDKPNEYQEILDALKFVMDRLNTDNFVIVERKNWDEIGKQLKIIMELTK